MSSRRSDSDPGEQATTGDATRAARTTRRSFVRTAAAGAGALALGAGTTAGQASSEPQIPTPQLGTDGNVLVDPDGNTVTLRGVNVVDPRRADALAPVRGRNAVQMVDLVTDQSQGWNAQVIRVPLQPSDIASAPTGYSQGPITPVAFSRSELQTYLEEHVDPVVERCEERGVYAILDYHRHWTGSSAQNNETEFDGYWGEGNGESIAINETLQEEVVLFWDVVASRYGDRDHCVFEVYNEPTEPGMWGDARSSSGENWAVNWVGYVNFIQPAIDQIAEHTDNLQLLGSPSWTQAPEGILIEAEDYPDWGDMEFQQVDEPPHLAMTYHIYPGHNVSRNENWDQVGTNAGGTASAGTPVYEEYPMVVTEFGWDNSLNSRYLAGTTSEFGEPFVEGFMEQHDAISWTAWCADVWWDPTMFDRGEENWAQKTETSISNPYTADVPQDCPDLPCEWHLLGEDSGAADDHMGAYIKDRLAEYADHNNPGSETDDEEPPEPPTSPGDQWTTSTTSTTVEASWSAVGAATSYNVFLEESQVDSTTSTSYTFTELSPETEYSVGVQSVNDAGTSDVDTTTVTTAADSGCSDSTTVDGRTVCNVDDNEDGYYEDFDADGELTNTDVVEFFQVQHRDAYKQPDLFDFSGNGEVGHGDVVALFEEAAASL